MTKNRLQSLSDSELVSVAEQQGIINCEDMEREDLIDSIIDAFEESRLEKLEDDNWTIKSVCRKFDIFQDEEISFDKMSDISDHFNASKDHNFYGCEVWTSAFGNQYQKGQDFGKIELAELGSLGVYQKGVKTKIGSKGVDYYGVIRACTARNIPGVIIEHAYIDHGYDVQKVKSPNFYAQLGVKDATAVAKYFKLKSSKTGADFSGFKYDPTPAPAGPVRQDETGPDVCEIKVLAFSRKDGNVLVQMTTKDNQSPVTYFAYSYDGGKTFSPFQMWDRSKETQSYNVKVPAGYENPVIVCRAYNIYELGKESNAVPVKDY